MKQKIAIVFAVVALTMAIGGSAFATAPPDHKVGICHRTASDTNPYVFIMVDVAAIPAHLDNGHGHPAKTNPDGSPRDDFLATSADQCGGSGYPDDGGSGYYPD